MAMSRKQIIWVVDDDQSIRWVVEKALSASDRQIICFEDAEQALEALERRSRIWSSQICVCRVAAGMICCRRSPNKHPMCRWW